MDNKEDKELQKLQSNFLDTDLLVLDSIVGDASIPERNWGQIVMRYEEENNIEFPISPSVCATIIKKVKKGLRPHSVFREFGISYQAFTTRFNKNKNIIEKVFTSNVAVPDEYLEIAKRCQRDPIFLLGLDIERASAYHFNKSLEILKESSEGNPLAWKEYMAIVHPEEFKKDSQENEKLNIVIKLGEGLLEAI